jgi:hypothetical protein
MCPSIGGHRFISTDAAAHLPNKRPNNMETNLTTMVTNRRLSSVLIRCHHVPRTWRLLRLLLGPAPFIAKSPLDISLLGQSAHPQDGRMGKPFHCTKSSCRWQANLFFVTMADSRQARLCRTGGKMLGALGASLQCFLSKPT